jgi:Spy/CpxP family protein refolding chaperone
MKTSLALLFLLATAGFGQTPPPQGGPPRGPRMNIQGHVSTLTTLLSLSSAQQTQATKIFTDAQAASKTVNDSMRTARTSLAAAIKKNDLGAIEQLSAQIGTLEGQMTSINSKAEASFYGSLTPEQQTKADTLHATRGGMGGPGGMARRPPQN